MVNKLLIMGAAKFSLLGPLYTLFGWITRFFYQFTGNYGIAIILLTILIRGLLIPLNVSSQKSMIKMQALSGKTAELQRKYGNDKQKYNEELMKLQQENGAGGFAGCILPFLQLIFIWPIWRIVSGPLCYVAQVGSSNIDKMVKIGDKMGVLKNARTITETSHIGLIEALNNNSEFLRKCLSEKLINMDQLFDFHFLGMDLTMTPSWNPITIFKDPKTYVPLLIFPILVVATQILAMKLTTWLKPGYKEQKEAKERAKNNPARAGQVQEDQAEQMMKTMNIVLPIFMLFTTFTLPAAMGLYWVVGGIMGLLTQVIVYYMFTKPYEAKKAEMAVKKANAFKKSGDGNNKK